MWCVNGELIRNRQLGLTWGLIRLVLPAGKEIEQHSVPGEITVQCLEGNAVFSTGQSECELTGGKLLYLKSSENHALRAIEDASLLVTILLH